MALEIEERFRALAPHLAEIGDGLLAAYRKMLRPSIEDRKRMEARFTEARDRFEALDAEDRGQLFRAINPGLAPTIEGAWQLLLRLPYQGSYLRKGFRAPHHPACTLLQRGNWLADLIRFHARTSCDMASLALGTGLIPGTHHMAGVLLAAALDAGTAESGAVYGALAESTWAGTPSPRCCAARGLKRGRWSNGCCLPRSGRRGCGR